MSDSRPTEIPDITARCGLAAADERYATGALYREAADEIRQLRRVNADLLETLNKLSEADEHLRDCRTAIYAGPDSDARKRREIDLAEPRLSWAWAKARAALTKSTDRGGEDE